MFCEKCGTKNEKDALFCEKCGAKLSNEEVVEKKTTKTTKIVNSLVKQKKPISKKQKYLYTTIGVVAIVIIGLYFVGSKLTDSKSIGENYFKALANEKYDSLYKYHSISSNNKMTSKKAFKNIVTEALKNNEIDKYSNLKVEKTDERITISYLDKDSNENESITLKYVVDGKKWLLFKNYKIVSVSKGSSIYATTLYSTNIIKNVSVKVPAKTKVKVGDVSLSDKLIDKNKSEDNYNIYVIDEMFDTKYPTTITLSNGLEFKSNISYNKLGTSLTSLVSSNNMSNDSKKEVINNVKKFLQSFYDSAIAGKEFNEFTKNYKDEELSGLETMYNNIKSKSLNEFKILELNITRMSSSYSDKYYIVTNIKYSYKKGDIIAKDRIDSYVYLYFNYNSTVPVELGSLPYIY